MRLILDAHVSGRAVGRALAEDGHDVRAIDAERELEGLEDRKLLELALSENRTLVSANEKDFVPLVKEFNERGESHPGCILIPKSVRNEDFGAIISGIRDVLEDTSQEDWIDRVEWIKR